MRGAKVASKMLDTLRIVKHPCAESRVVQCETSLGDVDFLGGLSCHRTGQVSPSYVNRRGTAIAYRWQRGAGGPAPNAAGLLAQPRYLQLRVRRDGLLAERQPHPALGGVLRQLVKGVRRLLTYGVGLGDLTAQIARSLRIWLCRLPRPNSVHRLHIGRLGLGSTRPPRHAIAPPRRLVRALR